MPKKDKTTLESKMQCLRILVIIATMGAYAFGLISPLIAEDMMTILLAI